MNLPGLIDYDGCGDGDRGLMSLLNPKWERGHPGVSAVEGGASAAWPGGFGIRVGIDPLNGKGHVRRAHAEMATPAHVFYYKVNAPSDFLESSRIRFMYGTTTQFQVTVNFAGGVEIRNASDVVVAFVNVWEFNRYRHMYVQARIHNTLGLCKVYMDTDLIVQASGIDTQAAAVGLVNGIRWENGENQNIYVDDWLVFDWTVPGAFFPGPTRISARQMNSDQTPLDWTPTPGGSHFSVIDELPFNAADFISTTLGGNIDMFGLADDGVTGDPVAVRTITQMKAQVLPAVVRSRIRDGAVVAQGAPWALTASSRVYDDLFASKPNSTQWDEPSVDGLHCGVEKV